MRFFAIILLACFLLFSATPALSATTFPYEPLEPTFFGQNVQTVQANTFFSRLYTVALGAAVVLAVLMIVIAGVEYTAGGITAEMKSDAKKKIVNALVGLFIVFFAWLLLKTINPQLVNTELTGITIPPSGRAGSTGVTPPRAETFNSYQQDEGLYFIEMKVTVWEVNGPYNSLWQCQDFNNAAEERGQNTYLCSQKQNGVRWLNTIMVQRLAAVNAPDVRGDTPCLYDSAGIQVMSACTTVALLPELSVSRLRLLAQTLGAGAVMVTAGTEPYGHTSHGPRLNVVDLRATPQLVAYLKQKKGGDFAPCARSSSGGLVRDSVTLTGSDPRGAYYWEPRGCGGSTADHFHVVFN